MWFCWWRAVGWCERHPARWHCRVRVRASISPNYPGARSARVWPPCPAYDPGGDCDEEDRRDALDQGIPAGGPVAVRDCGGRPAGLRMRHRSGRRDRAEGAVGPGRQPHDQQRILLRAGLAGGLPGRRGLPGRPGRCAQRRDLQRLQGDGDRHRHHRERPRGRDRRRLGEPVAVRLHQPDPSGSQSPSTSASGSASPSATPSETGSSSATPSAPESARASGSASPAAPGQPARIELAPLSYIQFNSEATTQLRLIGLTEALRSGQNVLVTFDFGNGNTVTGQAPIAVPLTPAAPRRRSSSARAATRATRPTSDPTCTSTNTPAW